MILVEDDDDDYDDDDKLTTGFSRWQSVVVVERLALSRRPGSSLLYLIPASTGVRLPVCAYLSLTCRLLLVVFHFWGKEKKSASHDDRDRPRMHATSAVRLTLTAWNVSTPCSRWHTGQKFLIRCHKLARQNTLAYMYICVRVHDTRGKVGVIYWRRLKYMYGSSLQWVQTIHVFCCSNSSVNKRLSSFCRLLYRHPARTCKS